MTILLQGNSNVKTYINDNLVDQASINVFSDGNGVHLQTDYGVTTFIPKDQLQKLLTIPARSQSLDTILESHYPVSSKSRRRTKRKRGRKAKKKSRKKAFRKK